MAAVTLTLGAALATLPLANVAVGPVAVPALPPDGCWALRRRPGCAGCRARVLPVVLPGLVLFGVRTAATCSPASQRRPRPPRRSRPLASARGPGDDRRRGHRAQPHRSGRRPSRNAPGFPTWPVRWCSPLAAFARAGVLTSVDCGRTRSCGRARTLAAHPGHPHCSRTTYGGPLSRRSSDRAAARGDGGRHGSDPSHAGPRLLLNHRPRRSVCTSPACSPCPVMGWLSDHWGAARTILLGQ